MENVITHELFLFMKGNIMVDDIIWVEQREEKLAEYEKEGFRIISGLPFYGDDEIKAWNNGVELDFYRHYKEEYSQYSLDKLQTHYQMFVDRLFALAHPTSEEDIKEYELTTHHLFIINQIMANPK